jgi:hypothetical protein
MLCQSLTLTPAHHYFSTHHKLFTTQRQIFSMHPYFSTHHNLFTTQPQILVCTTAHPYFFAHQFLMNCVAEIGAFSPFSSNFHHGHYVIIKFVQFHPDNTNSTPATTVITQNATTMHLDVGLLIHTSANPFLMEFFSKKHFFVWHMCPVAYAEHVHMLVACLKSHVHMLAA